jgi:hypothetical protein
MASWAYRLNVEVVYRGVSKVMIVLVSPLARLP